MSEIEKKTVPAVHPAAEPGAELGAEPNVDPELGQALAHFRANVHAWGTHVLSQAAYGRQRPLSTAAQGTWRPVLGWALASVLVAGGLSGGVYEHHHRQVMAQLAEQARQAREQQLAAQQQRTSDEDLLATVDSDVSRDVPAAMEPLEHLMDEDSGQ
jgi:hypothetical protein